VARVPDDDNVPSIARLLALTDGVVAIALTLLVLQLQVPIEHDVNSPGDLWSALNVDGNELTSYLVSFVVIAQFWLVHYRVLRGMKGHDEGLAWRNFAFLLALTLMPFTSDLLGRYGGNPVALTLFGLNLIAINLSTQWISHYAASKKLLVDQRRSAHDELAGRVRAALVVVIVLITITLAWTDPSLAKFGWVLFIFVPTSGERIARALERSRQGATSATG